MKKRVVTMLLSGMLAVTVLAGCGNKTAAPAPTTVETEKAVPQTEETVSADETETTETSEETEEVEVEVEIVEDETETETEEVAVNELLRNEIQVEFNDAVVRLADAGEDMSDVEGIKIPDEFVLEAQANGIETFEDLKEYILTEGDATEDTFDSVFVLRVAMAVAYPDGFSVEVENPEIVVVETDGTTVTE